MTDILDRIESNVRFYSRRFPCVFSRASNALLWDESGREFVDFLAGAGALNYGHNNAMMRDSLVSYLQSDALVHSLDLATPAKRTFVEKFEKVILRPRCYVYKLQFPGPTGTNAVEAALKLARKVTGRESVLAFSNGFHGMTLGALAASAREWKRQAAGVSLHNVLRMPFDGFLGSDINSFSVMKRMVETAGSGIDRPAAIILETLQAEGGLNLASNEWLRQVAQLASRLGSLLILDEIQVGCGRTGPFFSFEPSGIVPDIICLSKSISGFGLPMSLVLIKPQHDKWQPGEHNGTFRGNNLAFIAATSALEYWTDKSFEDDTSQKAALVRRSLLEIAGSTAHPGDVKGRGLLQGISWEESGAASRVAAKAFEMGLIAELCGPRNEVVKIMPPLTIDNRTLERGLSILSEAVRQTLQ